METIKALAVTFYCLNAVMGFKKAFIFIIGNRSAGKSFAVKCYCVRQFLKKKREFIYVRRYKDDLESTIKGFFGDIAFLFPNVKFDVKGKRFYINDEIAGYGIPLSLSHKHKSASYVNVYTIFYDEILPENGRYLKDEWNTALGLYQTVARGGGKAIRDDVKFIFVANHVTWNNPYFNALNIRPIENAKYYRGKGYVVEIFTNDSVSKAILDSEVGELIAKGSYGEYAVEGKFLLDNKKFIETLPKERKILMIIKRDGKEYGVYKSGKFIYISTKVDQNCVTKYVFSNEDHELNYTYINHFRGNNQMKELRNYYEKGRMFFTNNSAKTMFYEIMHYID